MKALYICAPYGARNGLSPEQLAANVETAFRAAAAVVALGYCPLIPHAYHYVNALAASTCDEDRWLMICLELLSRADGIVLLPGWQDSRGCFCEYIEAKRLGLPIYEGVERVPEV